MFIGVGVIEAVMAESTQFTERLYHRKQSLQENMKITINVNNNSVEESSDEEENPGTSASGRGLQSFKRKLSSKKESTVEEVDASVKDITINAAEKGGSREVGIQVMMCDCGFEIETPEASPLPKEEVNGVI